VRNGIIISYRDDGDRPRSEVLLASGERILVALDHSGLSVARPDGSMVFRASSVQVSHLCAGLVDAAPAFSATPLRILLGALVQLSSVSAVKAAFDAAAKKALG
jgi:hypothetical protein